MTRQEWGHCAHGWRRKTHNSFAAGCPECRIKKASKERAYRSGTVEDRERERHTSRLGDYVLRRVFAADGKYEIVIEPKRAHIQPFVMVELEAENG